METTNGARTTADRKPPSTRLAQASTGAVKGRVGDGKTISWARYLRPYKRPLAIGGVMLLLTNLLSLGFPLLLERIIDAIKGDKVDLVPTLALLMIAFAIGTAICRIASRLLIFNSARDAEYDLRNDLLGHLLRLEPGYYRNQPIGDTLSRVTNDVQTVRALWGVGFLNLINTVFSFGARISLMVLISPTLTALAIVPYTSMILIGRIFGKLIYRSSRAVQRELGKLSSTVQEDVSGVDVIKAYALESDRQAAVSQKSHALLESNMRAMFFRVLLMPTLTLMTSFSAVIILWKGGQYVANDTMTLGEFTAFNALLLQLAWPTLALGWMISLIQRGRASWSRLVELLMRGPKITDGEGPAIDDPVGKIEVDGLTLRIDDTIILDDITMTIEAGESVAIVGRTGSGKSTLIQCLARLHDIPQNRIYLDDRDITDLPLTSLRQAIGYSPQEAFLFSRSIRDNVAVGVRPKDRNKLDDVIDHSLETAGLLRDLDALPKGRETMVGERGVTLSGGQRQRVALARALATKPAVLLLDDSLSSVDAETEQEILSMLGGHLANRTAVIVSHRISAIKRCDKIFVLAGGRIVQSGTHDSLLEQGGEYADIYRSQFDPDAAKGAA